MCSLLSGIDGFLLLLHFMICQKVKQALVCGYLIPMMAALLQWGLRLLDRSGLTVQHHKGSVTPVSI